MRSTTNMEKNLCEKIYPHTTTGFSELPMVILVAYACSLIDGNVCSIKVERSHWIALQKTCKLRFCCGSYVTVFISHSQQRAKIYLLSACTVLPSNCTQLPSSFQVRVKADFTRWILMVIKIFRSKVFPEEIIPPNTILATRGKKPASLKRLQKGKTRKLNWNNYVSCILKIIINWS